MLLKDYNYEILDKKLFRINKNDFICVGIITPSGLATVEVKNFLGVWELNKLQVPKDMIRVGVRSYILEHLVKFLDELRLDVYVNTSDIAQKLCEHCLDVVRPYGFVRRADGVVCRLFVGK